MMKSETQFAPVPDAVTSKLNDARAEIVRIIQLAKHGRPSESLAKAVALATADALLAIVVAVEMLAREVRR